MTVNRPYEAPPAPPATAELQGACDCGLSRRECLVILNAGDGKCCDRCVHPWGTDD